MNFKQMKLLQEQQALKQQHLPYVVYTICTNGLIKNIGIKYGKTVENIQHLKMEL